MVELGLTKLPYICYCLESYKHTLSVWKKCAHLSIWAQATLKKGYNTSAHLSIWSSWRKPASISHLYNQLMPSHTKLGKKQMIYLDHLFCYCSTEAAINMAARISGMLSEFCILGSLPKRGECYENILFLWKKKLFQLIPFKTNPSRFCSQKRGGGMDNMTYQF